MDFFLRLYAASQNYTFVYPPYVNKDQDKDMDQTQKYQDKDQTLKDKDKYKDQGQTFKDKDKDWPHLIFKD